MNYVVHLHEAKTAIFHRDYETALSLLQNVLDSNDSIAEAYYLLSVIEHDFRRYSKELQYLEKSIALDNKNATYHAFLSKALLFNEHFSEALSEADSAIHLQGHTAFSYDALGVVYNRLNKYQDALSCFNKAVEIEKHNPGLYFNLGSTLKFCGEFEKAKAAYETALRLNPSFYKARAALSSLVSEYAGKGDIDNLKIRFEEAKNIDEKLHLAHALSKELEHQKRYNESFLYLDQAKSLKLKTIEYNFNNDIKMFESLHEFSLNDALPYPDGCNTKGPLFVTGMPRSGTTLVERILSNHSQVATAGELPNFSYLFKKAIGITSNSLIDHSFISHFGSIDAEALGKKYYESTRYLYDGKQYLVDKLPLNILYAGLILKALPNAKVVCLKRSGLDTVIGNYRQLFNLKDPIYRYSLDLRTTALFYLEFVKLINLWSRLFPSNFYILDYETLVADPTAESHKLLSFCGIPWEPGCIDITNNKNPVATASSVQVRKPINADGIGQWKKYDDYLDEVKALLKN